MQCLLFKEIYFSWECTAFKTIVYLDEQTKTSRRNLRQIKLRAKKERKKEERKKANRYSNPSSHDQKQSIWDSKKCHIIRIITVTALSQTAFYYVVHYILILCANGSMFHVVNATISYVLRYMYWSFHT
jgi:hypothetical protein